MDFIISLLFFLIALDVIIVVHELGHLFTAKKFGVHCYEFSIGMGPKIVTFYTDKKNTKYNIRIIPFGGYVQMAGEESSVDEKQEDKVSNEQLLNNKKPYQRLIIYSAGVFMNFVLALVIALIIGLTSGSNELLNEYEVVDGTNLANETQYNEIYINSVNENETSNPTEVLFEIDKSDNPVILDIEDVETGNTEVVEVNKDEEGLVGIQIQTQQLTGFSAVWNVFSGYFSNVFTTLELLFTGSAGVSDLSGPVGIFSAASETVKVGLVASLSFIAFLSVNVGILNLLPIPALDGGRILFTLIEIIFRKPIPKKLEENLIIITFLLLIALIIFVTGNDILKLFT